MTTMLITGATGVLGRATIPALLDAGYHVKALSRSDFRDEVRLHQLQSAPFAG